MDNMTDIMVGGIILMGALAVVIVIITIVRLAIGRSRGGGANWVLNQLGYHPLEGTKHGLGRVSSHYVRTYNDAEVHYLMKVKAGFGKSEQASSWVMPLAAPVRFGLQVIERGIADASLGARASRAISPYKYGWKQGFAESIQTGDAELDRRFAVFGTNVDAARQFLVAPTVRAILLHLKHVDLTLAESEVRLDDPFLANSWGLNGQPLVDLHNQVAELLAQARNAVQAT